MESIRKLRLDEVINTESLRRLNRVLRGDDAVNLSDDDIKTEFEDSSRNPFFSKFVLVGDDTNFYLGMASIFFQRISGKWIAEIHDVAVDENSRRRGFGEALVGFLVLTAQNFCDEHNVTVYLSLTSNPKKRVAANNLYTKLGFILAAKAEDNPLGTNLYKMVLRPSDNKDPIRILSFI